MIRIAHVSIYCLFLQLALNLGCSSNHLPSQGLKALRQSQSFELYSLDPDSRHPSHVYDLIDAEGYYGWTVLGSTEVTDEGIRKRLIEGLIAGVSENSTTVAGCFNPRHGIRIVFEGHQYDFIVCFQCLQIRAFVDGKPLGGCLVSKSPQALFDEVLKKASVELPTKKHGA